VALLEQFRQADAAEAFRSALVIAPDLAIARFNLSLALFHVPDVPGSLKEAKLAASQIPDSPYPQYVLGLIAKSENRTEDALAAFSRVLEIDPTDVGANVNLGQLLVQLHRYDEAIAALRRGTEAEPFNATAIYSLGMAVTRTGDRAGGRKLIERFQELRASGYGTLLGQAYLEQGRYAEALSSTGAESRLVDTTVPDVAFRDVTKTVAPALATPLGPPVVRSVASQGQAPTRKAAQALAGQVTLFDADADGDLDLVSVGPEGRHLLLNERGHFKLGAPGWDATKPGLAAIAGDFDNDERDDLYVLEYGGGTLYHNDGGGAFSDVTAASGIPADAFFSISGAFSDADHDGDLDLLIAGFVDIESRETGPFPQGLAPAPLRLYRNNGNGTFTESAGSTGLAVSGRVAALVPTDYDNRRDVDFLLVGQNTPLRLMRNMRDGTFKDVAEAVGLKQNANFSAVAAGDVNKDTYTDFFLATSEGPGVWALSDGRLRFSTAPGPKTLKGASAAQFFDYDNDGLLDLITASADGLGVFRNQGAAFSDVTSKAVPGDVQQALGRVVFASGDLDGDGDTDLVWRESGGAVRVWFNEGGKNAHVSVSLAGKVSNRSGIGAKLDMRAGSLSQKLETYSATPAPAPASVIFGLGARDGADAVRILWPAGILQTEIGGEAAGARVATQLAVQELDRKPSSCPYLFAWNGERFDFVTDFMGGGEMGYWTAPGIRNSPDPVEYVRIREDQLVQKDGRYELRITNELEEGLFFDGVRLHVVSHPADVDVFPNEGMVSAPREFELYAARDARAPRGARDDQGRDVSAELVAIDRDYVVGFELDAIRGYAAEHSLILDLGPGSDEAILLLNGWTDYAFSSDNVAASQRGLELRPPRLEVRDAEGRWREVVSEIGIPVGRPQTVVVDLAGRWLGTSREARISTSMRVYWDQALVATRSDVELRTQVLRPGAAQLRWRGFSAEASPDEREPYLYDYHQVLWSSPWKLIPGRYTREGDVVELLEPGDDMFVISRPGDEIAVSFDAADLAEPPRGWKRTFLLYTDGFSKEMDINSAHPDELAPLPFHAMTRYPYGVDEAYPLTAERLEYMQKYNTRVVGAPLPAIEWHVVSARQENQVVESSTLEDVAPGP
jgi:Tfp pilus assembly protein PilF